MVKGLEEAEAESTGLVWSEGKLRAGSKKMMKPEVHCKMTKDRCPVAAREIPAGYGGETEINRLLRYVVESPFLETFIYQLENLGNLFSL